MAFTPFQLQLAGIVLFVVIALAMGWWVLRSAMGWHRGSTFAWFHPTRDDDDELDDDNDGDGDGGDVR